MQADYFSEECAGLCPETRGPLLLSCSQTKRNVNNILLTKGTGNMRIPPLFVCVHIWDLVIVRVEEATFLLPPASRRAGVCGKKTIRCHAAWKVVGQAKQDMLEWEGAFLHKGTLKSSRHSAKSKRESLSV